MKIKLGEIWSWPVLGDFNYGVKITPRVLGEIVVGVRPYRKGEIRLGQSKNLSKAMKFYFLVYILAYFLNFGRGENVDMNRFHLKMIWIIKIKNSLIRKWRNKKSAIHFYA